MVTVWKNAPPTALGVSKQPQADAEENWGMIHISRAV